MKYCNSVLTEEGKQQIQYILQVTQGYGQMYSGIHKKYIIDVL